MKAKQNHKLVPHEEIYLVEDKIMEASGSMVPAMATDGIVVGWQNHNKLWSISMPHMRHYLICRMT